MPTARRTRAATSTPRRSGQNGITYAPNVGSPQAVAFSAVFPAGFKTTTVAGHFESGLLRVETFNHFTDGSHRSDYYTSELFRRA